MHRKPLIAANWKMHLGVEESLKFITHFTRQPISFAQVDVAICPPFTSLYTASVALQGTEIHLGAQNCHWEDSGAFTGEVSPVFLKDLGCRYVIVGHSERRHIFRETDNEIAKKLAKATEHFLTPIFCVGETDEERRAGKAFEVLSRQLKDGLALLEREQIGKMVIAYEPVWAIGTGLTATPAQAQEAHAFIRNTISKNFGTSFGLEVRILYGGSVKPDNIRTLMHEADIDGALVGGASLKPEVFLDMVRQGGSVVK